MTEIQRQSGPPADTDPAGGDPWTALLGPLLQTREARRLMAGLVPAVFKAYAGDNPLLQRLAPRLGRHFQKRLSRDDDRLGRPEIRLLCEDPRWVQQALATSPELLQGAFQAAGALLATVARLDRKTQQEVVGDLLQGIAAGRTGPLLTTACRILSDIHREDPEFLARNLAPGFRKWVETIDFGELKEMVDHSARDIRAVVEMVNDTLWQHPTKVILLLSLLPSAANMAAEALDISAGRINELPPDLLADVLLSLLDEIDARSLARVINQAAELVRKVHTGSALLGEAGSPRLPRLLSRKAGEILAAVDPETLWKAKLALAETRASLDQALAEAAEKNPDLQRLRLTKGPEIANIRLRTLNRGLAYWDQVDDAAMAESVGGHLAGYDMQELAEGLNQALRLVNRLAAEKPGFFGGLLEGFVRAVDDYELEEAGRALRPLARAVLPRAVKWAAGILAEEKETDGAGEALDSLLAAGEV